MRKFRSTDGIEWSVDAVLPGSSNIMVRFRHPDGQTSRLDRYNWFISKGPEARSVTSRLSPERVMEQIDEQTLSRLFLRSMPVSRPAPDPQLANGLGGGAAGLADHIGRIRNPVDPGGV
ncbi:MAG TPA: hypothetical protein VEB19_12100 [Gemmatimonadaceae bacterium]|nr:hypothetical protein [Gemmatimonadaceae bacterium]